MEPYVYYLKNLFAFDPITKACITTVCAFFLSIAGSNWIAYEALFILVVLDTITGLLVAAHTNTISSMRFFLTGKKLLVYFILILAAHQVVRTSEMTAWLDPWMAVFCAATELISIIENASKLGVPIPTWIVEKLDQYTKGNKDVFGAHSGDRTHS